MAINRDEFFREATNAITGTLDLKKALDRCHALINRYFNLEALSFLLYDRHATTVRFLAVSGYSESEDLRNIIVALPDFSKDLIDQLLQNPDSFNLVANHFSELPQGDRLLHNLKAARAPMMHLADRALVVVGLVVEDRILAFLCAWKPPNQKVPAEEAELLFMLKEPLAIVVANALAHMEVLKLKAMLEDDNRFLQEELHSIVGDQIIGEEFGLKGVMEMVEQVAPKNSPVMLFGETGVGKDLIANAIHDKSARRKEPFIKVNCGAIPDTLIDSELFGHEKGAFTGAVSQKRGRFERAHNGTIFLDEIGELPAAAQVRLLRVIQHKEFERVGGVETIATDVRVISATNRNLEEMIRNKRFREDLFFRLNVFPILIPPLRQRKMDIPALLHYFIEKKSIELKIPNPPPLAPGALARLMEYKWPGNVREMENLVERELIMSDGKAMLFHSVSRGILDETAEPTREEPPESLGLDEATANHILRVLELADGKISGERGAAQLLGLNPNTLRSKMDRLGIVYRRKTRREAKAR